MKILYLNDTQLKARNPAGRLDNYAEAIKSKLSEVVSVAFYEECDAIVHGGDFFDIPKVGEKFLGEVGEILKMGKVPWYVVPGNHDILGYNPDTVFSTSLGVMAKHGVINLLMRRSPAMLSDNIVKVSLQGQEFHREIDKRDPILDYYTVPTDADYTVLVPHGMLVPKPFFKTYTLIKDLPPTGASIILGAHYHPGYDVQYTQDGIPVFNQGAASRDEASKDNLTRMPQYSIIHFEKGRGYPYVESHVFKCAQPGIVILDRVHIENQKLRKGRITDFRDSITDDDAFEAVDVRDILNRLAAKDSLPSAIIDGAMDRLAKAELSEDVIDSVTGFVEKPGKRWITKIILENFQSHEKTEIDLCNGLNALTGQSNMGKSSVIRLIKWILYNEPVGTTFDEDFMRIGKKFTKGALEFSDGTILFREKRRGSTGRYIIQNPGEEPQEFQGWGNNIPVDVYNAHQMPKIKFTKDYEISLNLATQHELSFLVSSAYPANLRAVIIGKLTGVNVVDAAIRDLGKDIVNAQREIKKKEADIAEKDAKMAEFTDLGDMGYRLTKAEELMAQYDELAAKLAKLKRIKSTLDENRIETLRVGNELLKYQNLDRVWPLLQWATQLNADLQRAKRLYNTFSNLATSEETIKNTIKLFDEKLVAVEHIKTAEELYKKLVQFKSIKHKLGKLADDEYHLQLQVERFEQGYQENIQKYRDTLVEAGECPVCHSTITEEVVKKVI